MMGENAQGTSASNSRIKAGEVGAVEVPIQARALEKLSLSELNRYRKARALLASGEGPRALLRENMPLAGLGVYEAFLAQSWSVRFDSPDEMVHLAEVAVEISQGFANTRRGADLQARSRGELANAFRTADRLRSAQLTFGEAYTFLQRGTGDPYVKARLFDLESSLLGTLREFPLALSRLTSLSRLYLDLGETHLAGRALVIQALYKFYSGDAEKAVSLNENGIGLIDRQLDPALFFLAVHNHLLFLTDLKLYPKAKRVLFESRQNLIYKDRINALRLRGIEGRIDYGMGNLLSAEEAFREAKNGAAENGMSFLVALLSLELAMALASQDKIKEALKEVVEAREVFLSYEIFREYLGSVLFLEELLRRGQAPAELIEATVAQINRKWLEGGPPRRMQ
jgi:tetratricopeptide (TPR) repeat protein